MGTLTNSSNHRSLLRAVPFYYGWVNVVVASVAMTATLPGRTHGLGLVTEPLLADLQLDQVTFARINLVATLVGAAFCLPVGWLIDRFGVRCVLVAMATALGLSTMAMSAATGAAALLATLTLVRGFGQSALSIVAMAAVGKWFGRRLGVAMGAFAVLLTFGFIGSVLAMGAAVAQLGWRAAWFDAGLIVLGLAPAFWLLARSSPESCGLLPDAPALDETSDVDCELSLPQAAATPAFWIIVLSCSAFNLGWSAITLFNESLLAERGLDRKLAVEIMAILTGTGLFANLLCGALASRARILRILAAAMALLAGSLAMFPLIDGTTAARVYAAGLGLSGGAITVVFFAAWRHAFGRGQLGRIQGAAQLATVLASAAGPEFLAESRAMTGSYTFALMSLAGAAALLACGCLAVRLPRAEHAAATAS